MKLFAIFVGGRHAQANVEVHDMRFVVAPSLADTHAELRRQWWGRPGSLHIDCWSEIDRADGFDVALRPEPFEGPERLFYVNMGGYEADDFSERHRNLFVVAQSVAQAKARGLKRVRGWSQPHRDDLYEAEDVFDLQQATGEGRMHIHLTLNPSAGDPDFTCAYTPLRARPVRTV
ncbi:MAG TPA: DUF1543 domain-containing protein [Brevundimonas sp.]|jgi:hypothetical protein|uniref:DUF1543 domain-containing protein n=1 Tax=Brevundimonas sp. TaxID=1871086 RepID=UPI002DEFEADD|nr:DUF1543 domain-containing protein [Brevundimonas sp.]